MTETLTTGNRRYCATRVTRRMADYERTEIATYNDATVRDNGDDGLTRLPQAMLRAYSNEITPENDPHDEHFVCDGKYYGESLKGFVLDCDGDIAVERVMGIVLDKHSFGHAHEVWTVLVDYDKDREEWNGWGDRQTFRMEEWTVRLGKFEDIKEILEDA